FYPCPHSFHSNNIARIGLSQALYWLYVNANFYEARSTAAVIARLANTEHISDRYSLEPWISDTNSKPSAAWLAASAMASSSSLFSPAKAPSILCSSPPIPPSDPPCPLFPTRAASTALARVGFTEAPVMTTLAAVQVPSSKVMTAAHP